MNFLWPILIPAVIEESASLIGGSIGAAIRAAIEAFAWKNRIEGAAAASAFWLLVIFLGWLLFGKAKRGTKLLAAVTTALSLTVAAFVFVHSHALLVPHVPYRPIIRPQPVPVPVPMPMPHRPWRRGDEAPKEEGEART